MTDSFVFYKSFYEAINSLPTIEEKWDAISGLLELGFYDKSLNLDNCSDMVKLVFLMGEKQILASIKHKEDGSKGGRPKKAGFYNLKNPPFLKTKTNDNVNVNVNVNDNISPSSEGEKKEPSPTNTDYEFITKDGIYTLTLTDYEYFKKGYKNVDVDKELEKMMMWCYSNENKRKTKRGMKTFINGWLSRIVPIPSQEDPETYEKTEEQKYFEELINNGVENAEIHI